MTKPKSEKYFTPSIHPINSMSQNFSDKNLGELIKSDLHQDCKNQDTICFPSNFKTRICRHFELGKCKLSGLCNFAHGYSELDFYQKMAHLDEQSDRTIETCSKSRGETSIQICNLF